MGYSRRFGIVLYLLGISISPILCQHEDVFSSFKAALEKSQNRRLDQALKEVANIDVFVAYAVENGTLSDKCNRDISLTLVATGLNREWAWKALDASSVNGPGILEGNVNAFGMFDECFRVKATNELVLGQEHDFDAKYCRVYYPTEDPGLFLSRGECLPDSCSDEDVAIFVYNTYGEVSDPKNIYCFNDLSTFWEDGVAVAAFVFVMLFLIIVACATLYDYWTNDHAKTSPGIPLKQVSNGVVNNAMESEPPAMTDGNDPESSQADLQAEENTSGVIRQNGERTSETMVKISGKSEAALHEEQVGFTNISQEPGILPRVLLSFSLLRNFPSVMSTSCGSRSYLCMNGMRFLSMTWIILGHSWQMTTYVVVDAKSIGIENYFVLFDVLIKRWLHHAVINEMNLAVETFFLLAGCLVTISFLKALQRQNGKLSVKGMALHYFHRYWRLTPVYMMVLFMYTGFFPYLGDGPVPRDAMAYEGCRESWWTNMLYLTTVGIPVPECMGWAWYLSDDFMYYIAAPVFIFFLYKSPLWGGIFLGLGWLGNIVARTVILVAYDGAWYDIYIPPWTRFGPYAIGIALGYIMYRTKCKVNMHWAVVTGGWILSMVLMWTALMGRYNTGQCEGCRDVAKGLLQAHEIVYRDMFALGVAWMVFACCTGYGGVINHMLSWKLFIPLSRLTYVGYLIHPIFLYYYVNFMKRPFYIDDATITFLFSGTLLMVLALSVCITLVFEVPFLELEKVMFPQRRKK